jgi:DNA-binding HxlR family transcriptional regulator
MQHTDFSAMSCPVARGLEQVGEWWSILILRDAFYGVTRFEEFRDHLGIAPNMLARRLKHLVAAGLLEKRRYSQRPPRDEYLLTDRGRDFRTVILAFFAWGNRHFAAEGKSVLLVDTETGKEVEPVLVDPVTGNVVDGMRYRVIPGPAANEATRLRHHKLELARDRALQTSSVTAAPAAAE